MRRAILLAALALGACAPPSQPRVVAQYFPAPAPASQPPAETPNAAPADPWHSDTERHYFMRHFAVLEAFRCRALPRDEAIRLNVALRLDTARTTGISTTRRDALATAASAMVQRFAANGLACTAEALPLMRLVQAAYPAPRAPARATRPPGAGPTAPTDSGWQPARPAPAPLPPLTPDQLDL